MEMSNDLSSIEELTERMVQREIDRQQSDGQSVHGLINFLKSEFRFADDPYCVPYVFKGALTETHYEDLIEFKEVGNSIAHNAGIRPESFFRDRSTVPRSHGRIAITADYYLKALLTVRSVGYRIADSIASGR